MKEVTLSKIIGETGVFVDGDWVESKDQDVNGDVRLIQLADIGDGFFINKSNRFLTSEKAKELKCTYLKQGDLLIARMPDPLGRACIFPGLDMPCVTVVDVCIVRPDADIANSYWLKFLINSYDFRNKINKYITGTTRQRISRGNLEKLSFKLPDLPDQIKIISVLSKAEKLIKERKASIDLIDVFLKSTFLKMFGEPLRNEKGWEIKKLSELVSKLGDGLHGTPVYTEDGEYYFINGNNLDNGKIRITDSTKKVSESEYLKHKKELNENSILVSINGTLGKVAFYSGEKIVLGKSACYFNLIEDSTNKIYLFHLLISNYFLNYAQTQSTGSTIRNVSLKSMREFPVPVPPIELQTQFENIATKSETLKEQFKNSLNELENLYGSLSQKAMNGDLDLSSLVLKYEEEYSSTDNDREEQKPIDKEKIIVEVKKEEEPEDKRYGDPFEVDEATAKKQGKDFYREWKKLHPKKRKSKLIWEKVSSEQAANWIKENYTGFHFTSEMLIRFLMNEHITFPDYYSSEELKKNPQANEADDLKSLIFSAVSKVNPFLKLEQVFYNGEIENFPLNVTLEDYELIVDHSPKERSGIYFTIIE